MQAAGSGHRVTECGEGCLLGSDHRVQCGGYSLQMIGHPARRQWEVTGFDGLDAGFRRDDGVHLGLPLRDEQTVSGVALLAQIGQQWNVVGKQGRTQRTPQRGRRPKSFRRLMQSRLFEQGSRLIEELGVQQAFGVPSNTLVGRQQPVEVGPPRCEGL